MGIITQLKNLKIIESEPIQGNFGIQSPIKIETQGLNSTSALLVEADTGHVVMSKNIQQKIYPASMTKVMTALIAIETLQDLNELVYLDSVIFRDLHVQNAALAGFAPGEWVPIIDLLYGTMLSSGAESTIALARRVARSEENFVQLMNQRADELGLTQTHYTNSVGFHHPNHYTTAENMIKLLQYALNNELFRELFTTASHRTASGLSLESTMFTNLPRLNVANGMIIGGRTGFTHEAGRCLISLANIRGTEYILLTAGARNSEDNTIQHLLDALYIYDQL